MSPIQINPRAQRMLQKSVLAVALSSLCAPAAFAQAGADTAAKLDEIIVTGTRAKDRTQLNTPVPVDVFTAADLRKAGVVGLELGQALSILLPSFNFPRQSNSGGSDHVRAAQLRGLSPDQVLVLINGKRRHTSAVVNIGTKIGKGTAPVDFNSIPASAIERIEVLRDGAGAQYGSDAIAGVINVILASKPDGASANLSYGAHHTDVEPIDRSVTDGQTLVADAQAGFKLGSEGFLRVGLEYKDRQANNRAGFDQIPFFEEQTPANLALAGHVNYRIGDPDVRDRQLWANGEVPIADAATLYGFATWSQRDSVGAAFFRYPDSRNNVPAIYPQGFRPETTGDNLDLGVNGGVRWQSGDWDFDASLTFGRNAFDYGVRRSLNASLGAASPTSFKLADYAFDQLTANFDARQELELGFAAPLTLALGAEYRDEGFEVGAGDPASYAVGPYTDRAPGAQAGPGLTPADGADTSRQVAGVYADLAGDVSDALFLDAAARYENYSDFGGELTGKFSGRLDLSEVFALRGAVSSNLRAPALAQTSYQETSNDFGEGGQVRVVRTLSVNSPIARALGAKDLEAETSTNCSLGLTADFGAGFNLALDVFRIDIDDRITLSERISGAALSDFIESNFGIPGVDGVNFFTNAVDTSTEGVDLVATWRGDLADGALTLTGGYGYARTEIDHVQPVPQQLLDLGVSDVIIGVEERNTLTSAAPRSKGQLSADWASAHWNLLLRGIRHGSTTRVFNFGGGFEPQQTYDARWQLDAEAEYRFSEQLRVALGASNLTDSYPERSNEDIYYFGNLPYDILSGIGVNGAFWYGRVSVNW